MSNSLWPHGLQHARLPCLSPTPGNYPNSCPLSWWCHPAISSSVIPFSCLQSFTASGSLQMSQFFTSGGRRVGVSASASVLPMNIQDWFPLELTGLISLQTKGPLRVFPNTTVQKHHRHRQINKVWGEMWSSIAPTKYLVTKRRSRKVWKIPSKSRDKVNIIQ